MTMVEQLQQLAADDAQQLAHQIAKIADGVDALMRSGLTERALVLLVADACNMTNSRRLVRDVLHALVSLRAVYLEPDPSVERSAND